MLVLPVIPGDMDWCHWLQQQNCAVYGPAWSNLGLEAEGPVGDGCSSGKWHASVHIPHETKKMRDHTEPDGIYWPFKGVTVLPVVAEARKTCRMEKQWVLEKLMGARLKNPSDLFLHCLMGSITVLLSWHSERTRIHLIPSHHCHFKVIWSLHFALRFTDREAAMWVPWPKVLGLIDF